MKTVKGRKILNSTQKGSRRILLAKGPMGKGNGQWYLWGEETKEKKRVSNRKCLEDELR